MKWRDADAEWMRDYPALLLSTLDLYAKVKAHPRAGLAEWRAWGDEHAALARRCDRLSAVGDVLDVDRSGWRAGAVGSIRAALDVTYLTMRRHCGQAG